MDTKQIIFSEIKRTIISERGLCALIAYELIIKEQIEKLCPTIPEDGTVNYIAFDVRGKNERLKLKTNRFLTRKLCLKEKMILPDNAIQKLAHELNETLFPNCSKEVRIDVGEQITANYMLGIGGTSCMTSDCSVHTKMYENNPNVYSQLIMLSENDTSRAMLVKLDNGMIFMDRVYSTCDYLFKKMAEFVKERGYIYREYTNAGSTSVIFPSGMTGGYDMLVVSGIEYVDGEVPFADTLINYDITEPGKLRISHAKSGVYYDGTLGNTNGYLGGCYICENCDCNINEDNIYTYDGEMYCEYCFNEQFTHCEDCGETIPNEDSHQVFNAGKHEIYVCTYCRDRRYICCENCNEYYESTIELDGDNYCENCYEDLFTICDFCGDAILNENTTEHGGSNYCEDCFISEKSLLKDIV